jgi:hypothetical protein
MNSSFCFDRDGLRSRLHRILSSPSPKPVLVFGESGSGKSTIIGAVLSEKHQNDEVLHFEFQKENEGLLDFLNRESSMARKKTLLLKTLSSFASIKSIKLQLPLIGSIDFEVIEDEHKTPNNITKINDIFNHVSHQKLKNDDKYVKKLITRISKRKVQCLWFSNLDLASNYEHILIAFIAKHCSGKIYCVLEGALRINEINILMGLYTSNVFGECNVELFPVKNFDEYNGIKFFEYKKLHKKGFKYDHIKMQGNPACIVYDMSCRFEETAYSHVISEFLTKSHKGKSSLALLAIMYGGESNFGNLVQLATWLEIEVDFDLLLSCNLIELTEQCCTLAHPKLCRYLLVTQRKAISEIVKSLAQFPDDKITEHVVIACLCNWRHLSNTELSKMIHHGIKYAIKMMEAYKYDEARVLVKAIDSAYEATPVEMQPQVDTLINQVEALYQERIIYPDISDTTIVGAVNVIIAAQSLMKSLEYEDCIALAHVAEAIITTLSLDKEVEQWLMFCIENIKASVYVASGEFENAEKSISIINDLSSSLDHNARAMNLLIKSFVEFPLPDYSSHLKHTSEAMHYLKVRIDHNKYTGALFIQSGDPYAYKNLSEYIFPEMYKSGTVESTFSLNSLALSALFTKGVSYAIELFFDLLDMCIYEYDYFTAHVNLGICFALNDDPSCALEHIEEARTISNHGRLIDPVFKHKLQFNHALICALAGNWAPAITLQNEKERFLDESEKHRREVVAMKFSQLQQTTVNNRVPLNINAEAGLEEATCFWPQTLWYWDFSFPIVNSIVAKSLRAI